MSAERKEPVTADISKPILDTPVVPSHPAVSRESFEDPDVLAATNHTLDYNDTKEEILDIDDTESDVHVNSGGIDDVD